MTETKKQIVDVEDFLKELYTKRLYNGLVTGTREDSFIREEFRKEIHFLRISGLMESKETDKKKYWKIGLTEFAEEHLGIEKLKEKWNNQEEE